jgi:hypothetical protein
MGSIFDKQKRLKPSQLRTVAERRFQDAKALCDTGQNPRANGAQYLCGFVIEILLKAQLIETFPQTANRLQHQLSSERERRIWSLIYRSHDLEEMLAHLPELVAGLIKRGTRDGRPYYDHLRSICASWTIYARYSTLETDMRDADMMLGRVRELKEVLK